MSPPHNPATLRRLKAELNYLRKDPVEGCTAQPISEINLFEWTATIERPPCTPYQNGVFHLTFSYPEEYPFKPPIVLFKTKIYHPNIDPTIGGIDLTVLHEEWATCLTISTLLMSLRAFLGSPDWGCVVVPEVGREMEDSEGVARQWVGRYAMGR
ncbi:ubiquitin-conjugating enzyme E2-17 kDa-like protein [Plenodomus tracheiphilus IPT5]|uniref:Ubiquitin-conjugating enzyme E2-17 kDa-like protein n=1 Tax=Plenodomus tracheiphilus IPT5 TaxID=1408161 RepID=A0A6A7AUS0_9PLEO|nr:ubiquitin-conjugating enzyme E2-17 kDa-like protein [Plenodomus tracheiphilus IPT5]